MPEARAPIGLDGYFSDAAQARATVLRRDSRRTVLRAGHPDGDLFVKIHAHASLAAALRAALRTSPGRREYENCRRLAAAGVPVAAPVGFAVERGRGPLPRRSLFAARWLGDLVTLGRWAREAAAARGPLPGASDLVGRVGALLAGIHERGFAPRDVNAGNIGLLPGPPPSCVLLDYEQVDRVRAVDPGRRLDNLAQVAAGLLAVDPAACDWLARGYGAGAGRAVVDPAALRRLAAAKHAAWGRRMASRFSSIHTHLHRTSREPHRTD